MYIQATEKRLPNIIQLWVILSKKNIYCIQKYFYCFYNTFFLFRGELPFNCIQKLSLLFDFIQEKYVKQEGLTRTCYTLCARITDMKIFGETQKSRYRQTHLLGQFDWQSIKKVEAVQRAIEQTVWQIKKKIKLQINNYLV